MKNQIDYQQWRGVAGRLWRIADHLNLVCEGVRYAHKPADLTYSIHQLINFAHKIREEQHIWLEHIMKMDPKERGRWPKL